MSTQQDSSEVATVEVLPNKVETRGRPTKYRDYMPAKVFKYVDECVDTYEQLVKSESEKGTTYENVPVVNIPTREELCTVLGIFDNETLTRWGKSYKDFNAALTYLDREQKRMLLKGGLERRYEPTIAKLILSHNHKMSDKHIVEHEFTMKDMIASQEQAESVSWDDSSAHLAGLAELEQGKDEWDGEDG